MLDFTNLGYPVRSKDDAYKMGKDFALNGGNTKNCHFSIFSCSKNTKAWDRGKKDGKKEIINHPGRAAEKS